MSNLVIVAIPDENDRVWRISSEKVPHLTLLFLGDVDAVSNLDQIVQFVEHAANQTLRRFSLTVDRRDELGEDKADVLFFKKGRYDYKAIRDFRVSLLQDSNIRTAYDSADQHDGVWLPHLTLGYPASPAKPDSDEWGNFYGVEFNKIAIWTDNYEGPEFLLKDYWDEWEALDTVPMDVSMSSILVHISEEPWSNFTKADYTPEQWHAACLVHTHDGEPTSKDECKLPVKTPDGELNRNGVHAAAAALAGARGGLKDVSDEQKQKAASALKRYYAQLDEDPPESLAQAAMTLGEDFVLEHYGAKGMRWGIRKQAVEGGGHIRISNRTNVAAISTRSQLPLVVPVLGLATFLSPRARAEYKAAGAHNKNVKLDKKYKKAIEKSKRAVKVHNTAADEINSKISAFNNDKRWKGVDLTKNPAKQKEYDDAVMKELLNPAYANAAIKVYGSESPSGRYRFEINDATTATLKFRDTLKEKHDSQVEHAIEDEEEIEVQFTIERNSMGHILGFKHNEPDNSMAQSMGLGVAFLAHNGFSLDDEIRSAGEAFVLEHYGVKGMRWGVRNADRPTPTPVAPSATSRVPHGDKRKTKIDVEGGQNHPASDDAIKVAVATTKLKKSGVKALSNQELREVAQRLQLEGQVKQLTSSGGKKFVTNFLKNQGQQAAQGYVQGEIKRKLK